MPRESENYTIKIEADMSDIEASLKTGEQKIKQFKKSMETGVDLKLNVANLEQSLEQAKAKLREYKKSGDTQAQIQARINIIDLQKGLGEAKKALNDNQKEVKQTEGAYSQLSKTLNTLRGEYKNLAVSGQENSKEAQNLKSRIQVLDAQLKSVDSSVGQYQRNVGGYVGAIKTAFSGESKIIASLKNEHQQLTTEVGRLRKAYSEMEIGGKANTKQAEALRAKIQSLDSQLKKVDASVGQYQRNVGGYFGAMKNAFGGIVALVGVSSLFQYFKEGIRGALLFQQASTQTAQRFGIDTQSLLSSLREASQGTISDQALLMSANKAFALNITTDLTQLSTLLEVARLKGKALGVDATQAFDDIVTGIGRGSPLILDNLGIITKGWAEEAKATGKAYDSQFILNKVLQQGSEELKKVGGSQLSNLEKLLKLKAAWQNFQNFIGSKFIGVLIVLSDLFESLGSFMSKNIEIVIGLATAIFVALIPSLVNTAKAIWLVIARLAFLALRFFAIATAVSVVAGLIVGYWDEIQKKLAPIFQFIAKIGQKVPQVIANAWNGLVNIISGAMTWILDKVISLAKIMSSIGIEIDTSGLEKARAAIEKKAQEMQLKAEDVEGAFTAIGNGFKKVGKTLTGDFTALGGAIDGARGSIGGMNDKIDETGKKSEEAAKKEKELADQAQKELESRGKKMEKVNALVEKYSEKVEESEQATREFAEKSAEYYKEIQESIEDSIDKQKELQDELASFKAEKTTDFVKKSAEDELKIKEEIAKLQKERLAEEDSTKSSDISKRIALLQEEQRQINDFITAQGKTAEFNAQQDFLGKTEFEQNRINFEEELKRKEEEVNAEIKKQQDLITVQEAFKNNQIKTEEDLNKFLEEKKIETLARDDLRNIEEQISKAAALEEEKMAVIAQQEEILGKKEEYARLAEIVIKNSQDRIREDTQKLIDQIQRAIDKQRELNALTGISSGQAQAASQVTNSRVVNVNQTVNNTADAQVAVNEIVRRAR